MLISPVCRRHHVANYMLICRVQDDDLDYEEDVSQMKISVLVGGSKNKK